MVTVVTSAGDRELKFSISNWSSRIITGLETKLKKFDVVVFIILKLTSSKFLAGIGAFWLSDYENWLKE